MLIAPIVTRYLYLVECVLLEDRWWGGGEEAHLHAPEVSSHIPTRYRFWKLKPFSLSQACFASITSS